MDDVIQNIDLTKAEKDEVAAFARYVVKLAHTEDHRDIGPNGKSYAHK